MTAVLPANRAQFAIRPERRRRAGITLAILAILVQTIACTLILADAILDFTPVAQWMHTLFHQYEIVTAGGMVLGVMLGLLVLLEMLEEARQRETMVAIARGAMADLVSERFEQWGLTAAESEVALFALKGFDIAAIAQMRHAAPGTIRAQLSRVYEKAGVTSQATLMSSVVDEFLDVVLSKPTPA